MLAATSFNRWLLQDWGLLHKQVRALSQYFFCVSRDDCMALYYFSLQTGVWHDSIFQQKNTLPLHLESLSHDWDRPHLAMLHRHFCYISGFNFLTFYTKVFHTCPNKRTCKHLVTEELPGQRMPLIYLWCKIVVALVYIQLVQDGLKHDIEAAFITRWTELHPSSWLLLYLPYRKMHAIPI